MGRKQAASGAGGNFNGERWQEEASVVGPARRGNTPGRGSGGGEVVIKFGPRPSLPCLKIFY